MTVCMHVSEYNALPAHMRKTEGGACYVIAQGGWARVRFVR